MSAAMQVTAQGGHLRDGAYSPDLWDRFHMRRLPPQSLWPGDFLALLWKHKHPRWLTIDVASSDSLNRTRQMRGIAPGGTVWLASASEKEWTTTVVPRDCLPYASIKPRLWSDSSQRWLDGQIVRGWRSAIEDLVRSGHLRPSDALSYLIGADTWKLSGEFGILP